MIWDAYLYLVGVLNKDLDSLGQMVTPLLSILDVQLSADIMCYGFVTGSMVVLSGVHEVQKLNFATWMSLKLYIFLMPTIVFYFQNALFLKQEQNFWSV